MLQIVLPEREYFNENDCSFVTMKEQTIRMEHSLISLSKWEMKWNKPFLTKKTKSIEEVIDYLKCMSLDPNISDEVFETLPSEAIDQINDYMESPMTATWFGNQNGNSREILTSEVIYSQMIQLGIPFECQKWHLNRLFTLIQVCNIRFSPQKKMSNKEILTRNRELNAARKAKMNTKG